MTDTNGTSQIAASQTRAVVLRSTGTLQVEEVPLEHFGPLHVQVQIKSIGLNSADLSHYLEAPEHGLVLGREASGTIVAIGTHVDKTWRHLSVGARVVLEPSIPCRVCNECSMGRYNVCSNVRTAGSAVEKPYMHGFMRTYVNWPGEMVHVLPANVPFDLATLAQPLATVIHATKRAKLQPSSSVTVVGAGLLGLLTVAYARSLNCYPICLLDSDERRLRFSHSQKWGSHQYKVPSTLEGASTISDLLGISSATAESMLKATGQPQGYETIFDTTGSERFLQVAIYSIARAGKIVMMNGMDKQAQSLPLEHAVAREADLISSVGHANCFPTALSCLAAGTLGNLRSLLSEKVQFENAAAGFEYMTATRNAEKQPIMKVLIEGAAVSTQ